MIIRLTVVIILQICILTNNLCTVTSSNNYQVVVFPAVHCSHIRSIVAPKITCHIYSY